MGITIAYLEHTEDINISNIVKKIARKYNVSRSDSIQSAMDKTVGHLYPKTLKDTQLQKFFSSNYKITTKDFIIRAIYYIDST